MQAPIIHLGYGRDPFDNCREQPHHQVPLLVATNENLKGLGHLVPDFNSESVQCSEANHEIVEGDYTASWSGDTLRGLTVASLMRANYTLGRTVKDGEKTEMLVRDPHRHPHGEQVYYPKNAQPFVMVLAPPVGDDVTMDDFKAFWFDGSCGFNIGANVWHLSPLGVDDAQFKIKQSPEFGSVETNSVKEFGKYMRVPLTLVN